MPHTILVDMNITRFALVAAVATTTLWTVKAVAIGSAGGLDRSPLETPLFLLGLACCLVAAAATGIVVAGRRSSAGRALSAIGGIVAILLVTVIASAVVAAVAPRSPGWAWEEVNLWATMLTLMAVNVHLLVRRSRAQGRTVPVSAPLGV